MRKDLSFDYIAAFFDGEGSVNPYRQSHWQVRLLFAQHDRQVLEMIVEALGVGNIYLGKTGCYHLHITGRNNVLHVIRSIYPYSVVKRRQLKLGYQLATLISSGPESYKQRERLAHAIRRLNGRIKIEQSWED